MRTLILCAALLCCTTFAFSQSTGYEITGKVTSATSGKALESATVYLENARDSTLVTYTITDEKGHFTLEGKSFYKNLRLNISFLGYKPYSRPIELTKRRFKLGDIALNEANVLDEVIIKSRSPIVIKNDTLEFNVASFKTEKDAKVEDLLKKLPGVEVDTDGTITVNGKTVTRIMVNGKPFFGNDPTITTRNLSKEMIDKIQITDTKSKSQAFTGEESGSDEKTINLTISEDKNKGIFGRIAAGGGTDKRWEMAGLFNYFNNDRRISVLAGGNNINSIGFSFGELSQMFGSARNVSFRVSGSRRSFSIGGRNFGGGQGIVISKSAGFNYADNFGKDTEFTTDYFLSNSSSKDNRSSQREVFLPDRKYFTESSTASTNDNTNHNVNLNFDTKLDSTLMINIRPRFSLSNNKRGYLSSEESRNENQELTNQSTSNSSIESTAKSFSNNLTVTKNLKKKGSYLRLSLNNSHSTRVSDDYLLSETNVFGNNPDTEARDQFTDIAYKNNQLSTGIDYRLSLIDEKLFLNLEYEYRTAKEEDLKSTYDFSEVNQDYTNFNTALSTDFELLNYMHKPQVGITYRAKNINVRFDGSYELRTLENSDKLRPQFNLERQFNNLALRSRIRYNFSRQKSLRLSYALGNDIPQAMQLQAFEDVSNPLNTVIGNPNLEPQKMNEISFSFNNFNFQKGTGFYLYSWANIPKDKIISNTTIDENLVRTTTYANVNGDHSYSLGGQYSKSYKLDTVQTLKAEIGLSGNIGKTINFSNGIKYASKINAFGPSLGFTYTWEDKFELRPRYRLSYNDAVYSIDRFKDQNFVRHELNIEMQTTIPKNLEWKNNLRYSYNPDIATGFQKSSWLWNSTVSYTIMKGNGIVSLKAFDLLNQNTDVMKRATENYIESTQSTVLQRYFMLGFSYKFNTLGKAGETRRSRFRRF